MIDDANENNNAGNYRINNKNTICINKTFFEYKTKIIGSTPNDDNTLNTKVVALLKYLSTFWRFLDLPLINCEIEFNLK